MTKSKYVSMGCTFRELLLTCNIVEAIAKAACKDVATRGRQKEGEPSDIDFFLKQMAGYESVVEEILTYDDVDEQPMGFVLRLAEADEFSDGDWIDVGLWNYNYIGEPPEGSHWKEWDKDEHHQTFSATFADWTEHPSREIILDEAAWKYCHSLEDIVGELLWECTFSGFTGKDVKEHGDEVLGSCKAAIDAYFAEKENKNESTQS